MNEFNSLERRAGLQTMQGMQQATIHVAMFMELLAAQQAGNMIETHENAGYFKEL
jgi:hypothetical protein